MSALGSREKWSTVDDRGYERFAVIDYDAHDNALVSRELLHMLLTQAGMRLTLDAEDGL